MLELFLQKTRVIVSVAIVALLVAVFVINFGPQSQGCSSTSTIAAAAEVYGEAISPADVRAAFILIGGDRYPAELAEQTRLKDMVLYGLIEERLLAREAQKLGIRLTEDDIMEQVIDDGLVYVPMSVEANPQYLPPAGPRRYDFDDKDGNFSKENLKRFIQGGLQRSVRDFAESQIQATEAQRMRETILASVELGPTEAWDAFVAEKESAVIEYARFSPSYYAASVKPTEEDIAAFMAENKAQLDKAFEAQKHRYTDLEKQVRARHILVKVPSTASEEDKAAARKKAEALLARAKKGDDFAALAEAESDDPGSAKKGGDLGYNPKGRMVAPFDEAQFALKVGEISDVVESSFGFHVIKVEGIREGDVPVDEAKREIADGLYREQKASELAKAAAEATQAELAAGKSIEEVGAALPSAVAEGEVADPLAPKFVESRAFGRGDSPIAGPFDGSVLAKAAFDLSLESPLAKAPVELGDEYVVFKLKEKNEASKEDFTEAEQQRLRSALLNRKRGEVLANYVRELLKKAQAEKAVLVDESLLSSAEGTS